jgi:hypothetical protein
MVKTKKGKKKAAPTTTTTISGSFTLNRDGTGAVTSVVANAVTTAGGNNNNNNVKSNTSTIMKENLDDLNWLRECELRHTATGESYLQLEYQEDDELIVLLQKFLEESAAGTDIIDAVYQIWQQTVLSTLLQSSAVWKKDTVTAADQRHMKDTLKTARYKINFILHHVTGSILTATAKKWVDVRESVLSMCYNTLQLVPRLAESCPHHPTDIRLAIIHFEGKEFLAAVACETWDTLYDYAVPIDPAKCIPVLRRCAMLDILDKDWNMLGGWEDILKVSVVRVVRKQHRSIACRAMLSCTKRPPFCATRGIRCSASSFRCASCGTRKIRRRSVGGTSPNARPRPVPISRPRTIRTCTAVASAGTFTTAAPPVRNTAIISWVCIPNSARIRLPRSQPCVKRKPNSTWDGWGVTQWMPMRLLMAMTMPRYCHRVCRVTPVAPLKRRLAAVAVAAAVATAAA